MFLQHSCFCVYTTETLFQEIQQAQQKQNKPLVFLTKYIVLMWISQASVMFKVSKKKPIMLCISIFIISEERVDQMKISVHLFTAQENTKFHLDL